ncbi:MAG: efflux RND transporter permease subunit [Mesorhizobium sp.]|uniref:efflux RND transporter permease subunit n=2 Tax=Mesorhizobium sp. TaxID=1871066 RepID=UPI000FE57670|nr:efflux RND transporter permease subunit [Mesorhizobium sp.]RWL78794.1 MAG: efflux RND transporter permease subunit [Mesorhizobium sp.]RWL84001.1 MAG: efflux RND transporter permease subunit [Mesorhizobium sp.]RWL94774.1 MAG: efflux RND transporter permease subunit [Mesorhizobium sp.]
MKLGIAGGLTRSFIGSPLTPLFLLAALALGLVALVTLPREEEPQISVPMVDIHVQANGLKAEDAVKLVTEPLETIVKSIDGVEHVYSQTVDDGALVTARFKVGTSSDAAVLRVHDKVRANMDRIPVGIPEPLIVGRGIDDVAIVVVTMTPTPEAAGRYSAAELTRLARELQVEVAKLPDIGLTYIVGEQPEEIQVEPDPEKLSLYGITLQQLTAKISGANRSFQLGTVREEGKQQVLVAGQTLQGLSDIGNLLLTARDGRPVYVRDVASIVLATSPAENRVMTITKTGNGLERAPAVSLAVAKRPGTNAVVIADTIVKRLEQARGQIFPKDVSMTVTRDYGETANEKANELLFHLGLATISIVVLVAVAIGWREALVVAVVIPTTILLTLFASRIMGYTLNRVSLFALIFSIGILVDDAIVVIENIARHWAMDDGRSRSAAAVDAVAEVGNPTIVATLTVVAALLPMLFVSGMMGPYMSPIPANASAAMLFSFFVAVMLTPWLMMKLGRRHAAAGGQTGHSGGHIGALGRAYVAVARPILKSRLRAWMFLLVVGVATLSSMALIYTRHVTVKLLPFDNKTELQVVVDLPKGSSVEDTNRLLQAAVDRLAGVPEIVSFQTYAGTAAPFNFNGLVRHYYLRSGPEQGDVTVNLVPKGERSRASHAIALDLRERLKGMAMPAGTVIKVVEPPPGPPVLGTLLAEIYGPDAETRRAVAAKVRETFSSVPFIVDVDDSFHNQPQRQRLSIDQDNLEYYKVEQSDVYDTLGYLFGGTTVGYSHRGGGRYPIPIRIALSKGDGVVDQRALATPVPANALPGARDVVELGDVVRLGSEPASCPIFRHNGRPAEMVTAELAGAFEAPIYGMLAVNDAIAKADWGTLPKPEIALHGQPDDESKPTLLWDGEWEVTWVTFRDMGAAFMVAILGIYILVVAQFGSFRLPLVILTPIPLTLIGIMLGHWAFAAPFTATSMIGFIALAGIIVRNSILLVDFIRHSGGTGRPLADILLEAGAIRFKPILLTALAAMIGAAVILTDPIFQGLAISLLFGLASSTLLTVLVIPAIYVALRGGPAADAKRIEFVEAPPAA